MMSPYPCRQRRIRSAKRILIRCVAGAIGLIAPAVFAQNILINEIMFHPSSENSREEYLELYNAGPTNVNLSGWQFTKGITFTFPSNTFIKASNYLVLAAESNAFAAKYPGVTNFVAGFITVRTTNVATGTYTNFENSLSNTRDQLQLEDAAGNVVDNLTYADEGDWAIRQRGINDGGYQGWTWLSLADGLGRSLELINPALPNDRGQNWAASTTVNGTPGAANSVASANGAPLVVDVAHSPIIPQSTNAVTITARIIDEAAVPAVRLFWRVNNGTPPAFTTQVMFDDGAHGDGAAGDGLWGAIIPAQAHLSVVEFYVEAVDASNKTNSWPRPAVNTDGVTLMDRNTFNVNALYQVDNTAYTGVAPLYKLILTPAEQTELGNMLSGAPQSDAAMGCTFVSLEGQNMEVRYLCSVRNRGHGSRTTVPHNYRIGFVSDGPWKGVTALNMNATAPHAQHFGSILALKSGAVGSFSRAAQLRINGGSGPGGTPANNHYAANEDLNSDWAEAHYPNDPGGNAYKVLRDFSPAFDYRGTSASSYTSTYFKQSNVSENDYVDIFTMLEVMGQNQTNLYTTARARAVINVEEWLLHLAVMNLYGNAETGLNTGYNDDYYFYRGANDPRFVLAYHDLDSILGISSLGTSVSIFTATQLPGAGSGAAMGWFMHQSDIEPLYYQTLQRLLDTTFAKTNFDALIDQTLGFYVPSGTINSMKTWMDARRTTVQGVLNTYFASNPLPPTATIAGEPRSPSPLTTATLTVGGSNVVSYRFKLNGGNYSAETPVATPISLPGLPNGSTNVVCVMGKSAAGVWQHGTNSPTISRVWVVNTAVPRVRLNEVLAQNVAAVNHTGTFPDVIELYNEGGAPVDLFGLRLTDDPANPNKFIFPTNSTVPVGGYLLVYANNEDGSGGLHTGFNLSATGEGVYLFHAISNIVLDSVVFGLQLPDLSIGRFGAAGEWKLCTPTFGTTNTSRATGDRNLLRINEWLTAGTPPFAEDFVELYNPSSLPVDFGGCSFTDNAIGEPNKSPVPPLTFIQSNAWLALTADGNSSAGADHIGFSLSSDFGEIALLDPSLTAIDDVEYGPQNVNVSQGRCSDGVNKFVFLAVPSPGAPNVCPASSGSGTVAVLPYSATWRFDQLNNLDAVNWTATNYDDSAWPAGQGVLARLSTGSIAEPIRTTLNLGRSNYYFRTTFTLPTGASSLLLTHYIDDGAVVYLNGAEAYRYNMPNGPVAYGTPASSNFNGAPGELGPFALPMTNIAVGVNVIAIEVHQSTVSSADVFMGAKLDVTTNSASSAGLVINEILANNSNIEEPDGTTPDWIEIYNPSVGAVDLVGARLTDNIANPGWTFPSGSIVPGKGYYRVFFSSSSPVSATNTGFGLKDSGDSVYFFGAGGGLLDSITFGLQATDFSIGRLSPSSTNWVLNIPTPGATNLVQNIGDPALVRVNEWMPNPTSGDDWFELFNGNPIPVAISDYWLSDNFDTVGSRMTYRIPKLSFIGINAYAYRVFYADNNPQNGANHVNFKLGNTEAVGYSQPNGNLIDGVSYTNALAGVSSGRLPDGAPNIVNFTTSQSPGDLNWFPLNNIVINEVLSHTDPPLEDAVEIQNTNGASVNITGWFLSDSKNNLRRYQITNSITVPAGGFRVFYETQFNDTTVPAQAFSLSSAHGDEVYLSAATNGVLTGYRAQVTFDAAANGVSFGRYRRSDGQYDFVAMSARTFGVDNPTDLANFRTGTGKTNAYPKVGPVVFNEIMYHPPDIMVTNDNTQDEFLELKNITGSTVPLFDPAYPTNRWRLRGGVDFDFPSNTTIAANSTLLVVSFSPTNASALSAFKTAYGLTGSVTVLGPWSGKLDNSSEGIEIQRPDTPQLPPANDAGFVPYIVVERVVYADLPPWPQAADGSGFSLQRVSGTGYGNDPTNWIAAAANPVSSGGSGDTDGDGIPDAWENQYPLAMNANNPADAGEDYDGDGMTNLQEYLAGTNPQDPNSRLLLVGTLESPARIRLQFNAVSNVTYDFQSRTSLSTGTWLNLVNVPAAPSNRTVTITNTATPMNFYRVVVP